ncbi:DUF4166 domain-containing protein [Frigidibacter sp. MR17.24]|uniref:DUF4166 domain-containing protein n=1 Tax=Frigidibacter sp. MR17.24 TaxID=3127345 RepID=UPI003012B1C5
MHMAVGRHPFPRVLGPAFATLPREVRETHLTRDRSEWVGRGSVERGGGPWSRLIARIFGFPRQAPDVEVRVVKTAVPRGEIWDRRFGEKTLRSQLSATPAGMTERFGPFTFRLGPHVTTDGALQYPVIAGRLGPLPLPGWFGNHPHG